MRKICKIILLSVVLFTHIYGEGSNNAVIGSENNTIGLTIKNTGNDTAKDLTITTQQVPQWLEIFESNYSKGDIEAGHEKTFRYLFNINHSAPQDTLVNIDFLITTANGESWTKTIPINVTAPKKYSLKQNYPNPFNPITNISYELPNKAIVSLKVYNITGQEIATLVDEEQSAGIHTSQWNVSSFASGAYIYILQAKDEFGEQSFKKKMTVIK